MHIILKDGYDIAVILRFFLNERGGNKRTFSSIKLYYVVKRSRQKGEKWKKTPK